MNTQNQNRTEPLNPEELKNTNGGGLLGGSGSGDSQTSILHGASLGVSTSSSDEDGNSSSTSANFSTDSLLYNQND